MRKLLILAFLLIPSISNAQVCTPGQGGWTVTTTLATFSICNSDGTAWLNAVTGGVPSGSVIASLTTCGNGWTEATELNGKTLVGTLAANGNVGTTGGNDNVTPTGTNSVPTFTGNAITFTEVINHTHTVTSVGSAATGATTNLTGASDTSSTTATAANPAGGVASFQKTPTGSVTAPIFTGGSLDNRSAFTRVIFCKKN